MATIMNELKKLSSQSNGEISLSAARSCVFVCVCLCVSAWGLLLMSFSTQIMSAFAFDDELNAYVHTHLGVPANSNGSSGSSSELSNLRDQKRFSKAST